MKQPLADALSDRGYATLTPVQQEVTKPELEGADLLVSAQTGSGKTLGFGLAIASTILGDADRFTQASAPVALVIAPTRELAMQVKRELGWLYAKAGAVMASCVGGMDMRDERRALQRGAHIVVATPGRLRDHIMRGSIDLSAIRAVVLDEADEMLDLGFREDLEFILDEAPSERQTLLFSATVPASIGKLAQRYQKDAVRVTTVSEKKQHADIEYRALSVAPRDIENAIINVLRFYEAPNAIVFCNTRAMVSRLTTRLSNRGFAVVALSGELTQSERSNALQSMRDGRAQVCVATDVAARGIDLPGLDLVVHADLPSSHETLLHRSGRTGRAGRKGVSTLIVPPSARKKAERILKFAKLTAEWGAAPSAEEVIAQDRARIFADPMWQDPVTEGEQDAVAQLTERFSADQLAAAFLRLHQSRHSAPEELSAVVERPQRQQREAFGPSRWFSVAMGRADGADPRRLLPMLCKAGDITRDDIGAIRIQQAETFVEILKASADGFEAAIGPDMTIEDVALTALDTPPDLSRSERPGKPRRFDKPAGGHRKGPRPDHADRPERAAKVWSPATEGTPDEAPAPRKPRKKASDAPAGKRDGGKKPGGKKPEGKKPFAKKPGGKKPGFKRAEDGKPAAKRKGPPPPKGKPSSKKNRARAEGAGAKGKGGDFKPRRKPTA